MSWQVTFDHGTAFITGPKAESRRRIAACGDHAPTWVGRMAAWATSPAVANRVLDQLEARRMPVTVEDTAQAALDLMPSLDGGAA
jgi:hypothetical protein